MTKKTKNGKAKANKSRNIRPKPTQAGSAMFKVIKDFRELLPPLTAEEYEELKRSIQSEGIRERLLVWKERGILVDGHNRYKICKELGVKLPPVREKSFKDKEEVKLWILDNQAGRRNMTQFQRIEVILKLKDSIAARAKANQQAGGGALYSKVNKPVDTYKTLAKLAGVSSNIIRRAEYIKDNANTEEAKKVINTLRQGKARITGAYNKILKGTTSTSETTKKVSTVQETSEVSLPTVVHVEGGILHWKQMSETERIQYVFAFINKMAGEQSQKGSNIYDTVSEWANKKKNDPSSQQD